MAEAAVQIQRFAYVEQLGTYTQDIDDVGKTYAIFKISRRRSSANEGVDWENNSPNSLETMY